MKIKDMTQKTFLEVEDSDLLVIEDAEDTKSITVSDLKKYLASDYDKNIKRIINQTLDNIIASLSASKYVLEKRKTYRINTWIGSTSGNIQITLKDIDTDKWLTQQELLDLELPDDEGNIARLFGVSVRLNDGDIVKCSSYTILDFNTEHENPEEVNAGLSTDNAGFIKAHFDGLIQNEIAGIRHHDIIISLEHDDVYSYEFLTDRGSFANAVSFEEPVSYHPSCCCCVTDINKG